MNGLRAVVVCLVIACAAVVSPAAAVTPDPAATPSWSALPVPAAAPPVTVSDLAARGPGEAWATGYEQATDGLRPMLYRWNGTAWSRDTSFPGAGEPGRLGKVQFVGTEVWILHNRAGAGELLRRSAGGCVMTLLTALTTARAATEPLSWHHVPVPDRVRPQAALNEAVAFGPDRA